MQRIAICKLVQGQLAFEAEGIDRIFLNSKFNINTPIAILSVVGEYHHSDVVLTELLLKQLQANCEFWELLDADWVCNTINNTDMITLWPWGFYIKNFSCNYIVLVLEISQPTQSPDLNNAALLAYLSLASSTILEVSSSTNENRFRCLHEQLLSMDEQMFQDKICSNILTCSSLDGGPMQNHAGSSKISLALGSLSPKIFAGKQHTSMLSGSNIEEFFKKTIDYCHSVFTCQSESMLSSFVKFENAKRQQQTVQPTVPKPQSTVFLGKTQINGRRTPIFESTVYHATEVKTLTDEILPPTPKPRSMQPIYKSFFRDDFSSLEADDSNAISKNDVSTSPTFSKTMSTFGFVQVAAETLLEKLNLKATKEMQTALQLLVNESQKELQKTLSCWDFNNSNFNCNNLLQNVLDNSSRNIPTFKHLEISEQKWVRDQAQLQLTESNSDLVEIESILAAFVAKNVAASDANALRVLINLNVLKNKNLKERISQNEDYKRLILGICNNVFMTFVHKNKHTDIFLISVQTVRNFCVEEFKRYIEAGFYSRSSLKRIVDKIINRCASVLANVMTWHFNHDLTKGEKVIATFCKKSCLKQIKDFKKQNTNKLLNCHKKVVILVTKSKSMYFEKINFEPTMKVSLSELQLVHEKARSAALRLLPRQIQLEIRKIEPTEVHLKALTKEIDTAWKLVAENYH